LIGGEGDEDFGPESTISMGWPVDFAFCQCVGNLEIPFLDDIWLNLWINSLFSNWRIFGNPLRNVPEQSC